MEEWMGNLRSLINISQSNKEEKFSLDNGSYLFILLYDLFILFFMVLDPLSLLHHSILQTLNIFSQKYDEEFEAYLEVFFKDIWALILDKSSKFRELEGSGGGGNLDVLIISGLSFLSTISSKGCFYYYM